MKSLRSLPFAARIMIGMAALAILIGGAYFAMQQLGYGCSAFCIARPAD